MADQDTKRSEEALPTFEKPVGTEQDSSEYSNTELNEDADGGAYSEAMAEEGDTALAPATDDELEEFGDDEDEETVGAADEQATRNNTAI
jgi:hypothetical protein